MRVSMGWVSEVRVDPTGERLAWVRCPAAACPAPGQALLAWAVEEVAAPLPATLFPVELAGDGFLAWGAPAGWEPGQALALRGPLGQGFRAPDRINRLALAALGQTANRLLPLIGLALAVGSDVALFCDCRPPALPPSVEIFPLASLAENLDWADFLAVDLAPAQMEQLSALLGRQPQRLPCPGQVLIVQELPCGGLAGCGVCAVPLRRGLSLACEHGPVFDLHELVAA